jgi:hypothetical protein
VKLFLSSKNTTDRIHRWYGSRIGSQSVFVRPNRLVKMAQKFREASYDGCSVRQARLFASMKTYRFGATPLRSWLPFVVRQAAQKDLVVEVPYWEVEGLREHHDASAYLLEVMDDGSPCP